MNRSKTIAAICCATVIGVAVALDAWSSAARPMEPSPDRIVALAAQRLQLDPAQQAALRPIVARAVHLRREARADSMRMMAAARDSVSKPGGEFRTRAPERDARLDARLAEFRALRNEFFDYYDYRLNPQQQTRVRELVAGRLDRLDRVRNALSVLRQERDVWQ